MLHITEPAVSLPHVTRQTSLPSMLGMRVELTGGWGCGGFAGPRLLFDNMRARGSRSAMTAVRSRTLVPLDV
jgi:hypothetical protein